MHDKEPTWNSLTSLNKWGHIELNQLLRSVRKHSVQVLWIDLMQFQQYEDVLKKELQALWLPQNIIQDEIWEAYRQLAYYSPIIIPERVFIFYSNIRTNFTQRFIPLLSGSILEAAYANDPIVLWLKDPNWWNAQELYDKISQYYVDGQVVGDESHDLLEMLYEAYTLMRTHPSAATNAVLLR